MVREASPKIRRRLEVRGQVQGVGFRPYVHRLALRHGVSGFVANDTHGAVIEIQGPAAALADFERDLRAELPPLAQIVELRATDLPVIEQPTTDQPATGETGFRIETSRPAVAEHRPEVTPDAATCTDCLRELFDPADRRYGYPFINCTNCGPRYSIIRGVPYDRPMTTMAAFRMCSTCEREYHDPADRRFHAQPNACPICGPRVWLERPGGQPNARQTDGDAIRAAAALLNDGAILAVKGLGGFHLACRADCEEAVQRLRERKLRDGKPLAIMVRDINAARRLAVLSPADTAALKSSAAPIVLLRKRDDAGIAPSVAPGCRDFGLMLAYTPLHHLLLAEVDAPLVMTSGNLAGEPLTYRDDDARELTLPCPPASPQQMSDATALRYPPRVERPTSQGYPAMAGAGPEVWRRPNAGAGTEQGVADGLLLHDRQIFRPIDDSVVFTFRDDVIPIRRARGYAPRPLRAAWGASASGRCAATIDTGQTPVLPTTGETPILPATGQTPVPPTSGETPMLPPNAGTPLPPTRTPRLLAVGGELKSAICLYDGRAAILSEHLGDLTNPAAYRHFVEAVNRLMLLCDFRPELIACDLHPTYLSTMYARGLGLPVIPVQHHHAHIASVMAEHDEAGPVVGIACDGTGYGTDGAVWGCEILYCARGTFERLAHLEYFPLLGGDRAAVETWRPAAALVRSAYGPEWRGVWGELLVRRGAATGDPRRPQRAGATTDTAAPLERAAAEWPVATETQVDFLDRQAAANVNAPPTSSLGRLFDAVAFLLGICDHNRHEAEAAMALEAMAGEHAGPPEPLSYAVNARPTAALLSSAGSGGQSSLDPSTPRPLGPSPPGTISFAPTIREIAAAVLQHQPAAHLAARFHETVARALTDAAMELARQRSVTTLALSGGCFANRLLLARTVELLEQGGFRALYNRLVPSGDGGIALGQAFVAAHAVAAR